VNERLILEQPIEIIRMRKGEEEKKEKEYIKDERERRKKQKGGKIKKRMVISRGAL
jgi:hypothetical protein